MTTDQIKDFITKTLLHRPEWQPDFMDQFADENDNPYNTTNHPLLNKKMWKRMKKWKFNSYLDFLNKQFGGDHYNQWDLYKSKIDPEDIFPGDVIPYGGYPNDNTEYICREFVSCVDDNGSRDIQMYVITDKTDNVIVHVSACGD